MNIKAYGLKRVISTIIALTIMFAPVAAFPADNDSGEKSAPKPSEPLKDGENPLMIGKRDINKRSTEAACGNQSEQSRRCRQSRPNPQKKTITRKF
jgi:hypothetical protein